MPNNILSKTKILLILFPIIALTACSSIPTSELEYSDTGNYPYVKSDVIKLGDEHTVHDFIVSDGKIIATDKENHCLLIIDEESGETEVFGQKGGGNRDFCDPTGIWLKDDLIYVVDSGNMRIKLLNGDLSFKESIDLSSVEFWIAGGSYFDDISVDDNGNIFITVHTNVKNEGILYCIENGSDDKKPKILMKNFTGIVTSYKDKTYCANTLELISKWTAQSGKNYIYEIEECKYINAYELPSCIYPKGIYADGEGIILSSWSYINVLKADLNALTADVIFSEMPKTSDIPDPNTYVPAREYGAIAVENGTVLLHDTKNGEIYKLTKE